MNDIDLDFDDELATDAEAFGVQKAQGVSMPQLSHPAESRRHEPEIMSLEYALYTARTVYGETNSRCGEAFFQWVQAALADDTGVEETSAMLQLLHRDKESFGGRIAWKQLIDGRTSITERLRARRHASICAMNVVHAVLNKLKGRSYSLWIQRALWRATKTENDIKTEG